MTIFNDLESVEEWIKLIFPSVQTHLQIAPTTLSAGIMVIGLQNDNRTNETPFSFRVERVYQLTYYGASLEEMLTTMDSLSQASYQTLNIPIQSSLRHMRVKSFSISQPALQDGGLYGCTAVMATEVREAREQEAVQKIAAVHAYYS